MAADPSPPDGGLHRPNVLLIVVDDLGVGDFGFTGGKDIPTPHIDRLAHEGVICTSGYVQSMCAPTRASLMTGKYPQRFGFEDNRPADTRYFGMDRSQLTLPQVMRDVGYATALVGKWHLGKGLKFEYAPRNRGFDEFFGYFGAMGTYFNPTYSRNGAESVYKGYGTDILTTEACDRIKAWKDRPFFLHLAYTAAHLKQQAKPEDLAKFTALDKKRQMAAAIISNLDENIGRVMTALQQAGVDERTLVFFLSDNGGEPPILGTLNGPYRGMKFDLYEGGIRVPFAVRWKGTIPAGQSFNHPVSAADVMPTALAAAKQAIDAKAAELPPVEFDGVNLLPWFTGAAEAPPHEALYWRTTDHSKWRAAKGGPVPHLSAMRQGDWKLVVLDEEGANRHELYNLAEDPGENINLAEKEPDRLRKMAASLDAWRKTLPEQVIPPKPD